MIYMYLVQEMYAIYLLVMFITVTSMALGNFAKFPNFGNQNNAKTRISDIRFIRYPGSFVHEVSPFISGHLASLNKACDRSSYYNDLGRHTLNPYILSGGSRISLWRGPPTSNEGAFRQERMRKQKNWVPWKWAALPPQGRIQDFVDPFLRGRGPLTRVLFGENVCENERIGTRRGACAGKFCM